MMATGLRIIKYALVLAFLLWLEKDIMQFFEIWKATPDLLLIFVVFISLREDRLFALLFAFFVGLFQDAFVSEFWGLSALSKISVSMVISHFKRGDNHYTLSYFATLLITASIVNEILYQMIYSLGSTVSIAELIFIFIVPCAAYTFLVGMLVYFLFHKSLIKNPS